MKLLDLFCGAGGAAMGYHRAGFTEIVGIDIEPQPDYPFTFWQGDALDPPFNLWEFDLIHASPPCQANTPMSNRWGSKIPELVAPTRHLLRSSGVDWVIENVRGAELNDPIELTGEMFDLETHRPRKFETSFSLRQPPKPKRDPNHIPVYGKPDGRRLWTRKDGTELRAWKTVAEGQRALGIDWTENWHSIREAIPPAYTQWIGETFLGA